MNEKLHEAIQNYGGMISTRQVQDLGISRQTLNNYVRSGKIERVGSGIYMLPDTIKDDMYAVSILNGSSSHMIRPFS